MAVIKQIPSAEKLICHIFLLLCLCILKADCGCNCPDIHRNYNERKDSCSRRDSCEKYSDVGPSIQPVTPPGDLTEAPHWDHVNKYLIYVDAYKHTLNKYDPQARRVTSTHLGGVVSACIPVRNERDCGQNSFVCGIDRNLVHVIWDGISSKPTAMRTLQSVEQNKPFNGFSDAKVDDKGVLWIGTYNYLPSINQSAPEANLYHYSLDKCRLEKDLTDIFMSNGIAWNKDSTKMYYIDSPKRRVFSFDYDLETSSIRNRRTVFDFQEYMVPGVPDGMTIDTEDNLWVCCRGGARVIKIDPRRRSGKLLFTLVFPVDQMSSLTFGGPNLDVLYCTSGIFGLSPELAAEQRAKQPSSGAVFAVYGLKASGRPANTAVICCEGHTERRED